MSACPLCRSYHTIDYYSDQYRHYRQCLNCHLVFVPAAFYLSLEQEKAEYDLHQNCPSDAGYRQFLSRLVTPLLKRIRQTDCGLDFGCGPGPAIAIMLQEAGIQVQEYDPIYRPDIELFAAEQHYEFITMTEVIEHIHRPSESLALLWSLLAVNGVLAIMTKLVIDKAAFRGWHYKNDPTHVCFYSRQTFKYIANHLRATLEFVDKDVIFLSKTASV